MSFANIFLLDNLECIMFLGVLSVLIISFLASLCNSCGLKYLHLLENERKIPVNTNPKRITVDSLLNKD